jgi:hypothetical protein
MFGFNKRESNRSSGEESYDYLPGAQLMPRHLRDTEAAPSVMYDYDLLDKRFTDDIRDIPAIVDLLSALALEASDAGQQVVAEPQYTASYSFPKLI